MKNLSIGLFTLGLALANPLQAEEMEWSIRVMNGEYDLSATLAAREVGEAIDWDLALASAALPCEPGFQII
jgi:hypothetical protein